MLLHNNQLDAIKRLAKRNKDKEQKLFAAACYLMKCSAEFVTGTKNYATFAAVEQQGAQYTAELSQLQNYSYTELKPSASGYPAVGNTVTYKNLQSPTTTDAALLVLNVWCCLLRTSHPSGSRALQLKELIL